MRLATRRHPPRWSLVLCVGGITLLLYSLTAPRGITGGDSGELAVVASHFSVAHPPGYPLYVLLAWLASHLPLSELALRLNLFSAACGAGAAALIFLALLEWGADRLSSALGTFLFASSPLVWTWSTRAEVFALNHLLCAALLCASVAAVARDSNRALLTCGALVGLGFANHHSFVFLAAPLGVALALHFRRRPRALLTAAAIGFALCAVLYAQLLLASPEQGWGETSNWSGFLRHVLREDYGTFRLASEQLGGGASVGATLRLFFSDHVSQLAIVGPAAALFALRRRESRSGALDAALVVSWLLASVAFHALARVPLDSPLVRDALSRFWMLPLLIACVGVGLGLAAVRTRWHWAFVAICVACVGVRGIQIFRAEAPPLHPGGRLPGEFARAVLEPLPPSALLLTRGDLFGNLLRYVQSAHGVRKDVVVLDQELLTYPWYVSQQSRRHPSLRFPGRRYHPGEPNGFALAQLLRANPERRAFIVGGVKPGDGSLSSQWQSLPSGLVEEWIVRPTPDVALARIRGGRELLERLETTELARGVAATRDETEPWEAALREEYWEARHRVPRELLVWAIAHGDDRAVLEESARELDALIRAHPHPPPAYFKNAGIAYAHLGEQTRMREAFHGFLEHAPSDDPDVPRIRAALNETAAR